MNLSTKTVFGKITSTVIAVAMFMSSATSIVYANGDTTDKAAPTPIQQEIFVGTAGDDTTGNGTESKPFATVDKARQEVAKINSNMTGDIIVNIAKGDYYLDETIQFKTEDSGTNGFNVIYKSSDGLAKARLIGGKKVSGWTLADANDKNFDLDESMIGKVYKIQLDETTPEFNTLYVNGQRSIMARTKNYTKNDRFATARDSYMLAAGGATYGLYYKNGDLSEKEIQAMINAQQRGEEVAQVLAWDWDYRNWFSSTCPVSAINTGSRLLSFPQNPSNPQQNRPKYTFGGGARYFLQGNLAFLDAEGEYHYNKATKTLYYYPKAADGAIENQEIIVPTMQEIIHIEGKAKAKLSDVPNPNEQVHNLQFYGLELSCTEFDDSYSSAWNAFDMAGVGRFPEEALDPEITNPSYCEQTERAEYRKGAMTLVQTNNIVMDSLKINNIGISGINMWTDNNDNIVKNSEISDVGLHGVNIDGGYPGPNVGKFSYNITVTNCVIHDMGELAGHGTGIQILQTHDSNFSNLEIYNSPRRAIFLMGGWAARGNHDSNFNRYRDVSTYNNRLEYLYLHDLQHDGGDDGAIFFCTLYRYQGFAGNGVNDTKPNYLNQVYMDNVGSSNSNRDFKPNCINFDMGCGGVVASNIKAVNPQHYNIRYNEGLGEITYDNTNLAYYRPIEGANYKTFDDTKMAYDKIGVTADFPYEKTSFTDKTYNDVYYRDEFDNGLNDWWKLEGKPETSPVYYSDKDDMVGGNSFLADAYYNRSQDGCRIGKPFGTDLNKVVEIDYFDHLNDGMEDGYCGMGFQWRLNSFARVDNGLHEKAIGVNSDVNNKYYSYKVGSITKATDIEREYGWHNFKWDYTSGTDVKMYVDGKLIATVPSESFNYIEMGDYGMGGFNAYDNVVIYGGKPAADVIPLPPTPEKPPVVEKIQKLPGKIEAENANKLPSTTKIVAVNGGGKAVGYISKGDVFEYKLEVTEDCEFPVTVRYAGPNTGGAFTLKVGDQSITVDPPQTGDWEIYKQMTTTEKIKLVKGTYTATITVIDNSFNLDWFSIANGEVIDPDTSVQSVKLDVVNPLVLGAGNKIKIPYTILPKNAANKIVSWSSDNDCVTAAADGTITAVKPGTANVTVTTADGNKTATCVVEVLDAEASLISTTANGCVPTADSFDHPNYKAEKLIDGDIKKGWAAAGFSSPVHKDDPSAFFTWNTPQDVKTIYLYDVSEGGNYVQSMEIIFDDDKANAIQLPNGVPDGGMKEVILPEIKKGVKKIEFHILKATSPYGNNGFGEIKVFSAEPGQIPVNNIKFASDSAFKFVDETFTITPPVITPSTATNLSFTMAVTGDKDVIKVTENTTDGILKSYTITTLKEGTANIQVTAAGGITGKFTVTVGSKNAIEAAIIDAECLYSKYPGDNDAKKAFKAAIDKALQVYNTQSSPEDFAQAVIDLKAAVDVFNQSVTDGLTKTAQEVADGLVVEAPQKGSSSLKLPTVPFGFKLEITSSTPAGVITKTGVINTPDTDTTVALTFKVTKIADETATATKTLEVLVLGYSAQDAMGTITITSPAKSDTKVTIPTAPYGFSLEIVSSTDDIIAKDGTFAKQMKDKRVLLTLKMTKLSNASTFIKSFEITLTGVAKLLNTPIQANEVDALNGSYIKVANNEVVNFNPGDWIRYDNVDFGETQKNIKMTLNLAVHPNWAGKTIKIILDDVTSGTVLGEVEVKANPVGGDWGVYFMHETDLNQQLSGVHTIYLQGVAGGPNPTEGVAGVKEIMFKNTTPVDNADLKALVDYAKDQQNADDYKYVVPVVKSAFEASLAQAVAIIANVDATQEEVDLAYDNLIKMVHMLQFIGNNTSLLQAYNTWKDFDATLYKKATADIMNEALLKASGVLENENALQAEIDEAFKALDDAIHGLKPLITIEMLDKMIKDSELLKLDLAKYQEAGKAEFLSALENAKTIFAKADATDREIADAYTRLRNSTWALRLIPNKSDLEELINSAKKLDMSAFTAESAANHTAALNYAVSVFEDESASQEEIQLASARLADATKSLVLVEDKETGTDDSNKDSTDKKDETSVPKTNDATPLYAAFAFAMLGCACVAIRRKVTK